MKTSDQGKSQGVISADRLSTEYQPLVSNIQLSHLKNDNRKSNISILRDAEESQSLLLRKSLPKCVNSVTGSPCRSESMNIPLHRLKIKSKVISGTIDVGIVSELRHVDRRRVRKRKS